MDFTPNPKDDSGCPSSFNSSLMFESTPKLGATQFVRKRKLAQLSPQFSSTLNESLLDDLCQLDIEEGTQLRPNKQQRSAPCTPVKRLDILSPIKEAREILFSNLKPVPLKKSTPQKVFTPCKKCLFSTQDKGVQQLLFEVINNDIIMRNVFKYLSNGDLYRFANVSKNFSNAVLNNFVARQRYENFTEIFKLNKENYVITPKGSPERQDNTSIDDNRNFYNFVDLIPFLKPEQSLNKCPSCGSVSIVENNISQCQNVQNCGYIYCKLCESFSSTGPEDFNDKCKNAKLQVIENKSRNKLEDLSNDSSFFTILNVTNKIIDTSSSGYYSDQSMDYNSLSVKRTLFGNKNNSNSNKSKILSVNNNDSIRKMKKRESKLSKKRISFVPVIKCDNNNSVVTNSPPVSPTVSPLKKNCGIGSKQSKKNLKRLTF